MKTSVKGKKPDKSDNGVAEGDSNDAEDIALLPWLDLYNGLISDTADLLKDELQNIKKRKISKNQATLKKEKKAEAVFLSKNIVKAYNDAISKAVKELQNHGAQMQEELQKRYNLPDDWMQPSTSASMVGSDVSGILGARKRKEVETKVGIYLNSRENGCSDNEKPSTSVGKNAVESENETIVSNDAGEDEDASVSNDNAKQDSAEEGDSKRVTRRNANPTPGKSSHRESPRRKSPRAGRTPDKETEGAAEDKQGRRVTRNLVKNGLGESPKKKKGTKEESEKEKKSESDSDDTSRTRSLPRTPAKGKKGPSSSKSTPAKKEPVSEESENDETIRSSSKKEEKSKKNEKQEESQEQDETVDDEDNEATGALTPTSDYSANSGDERDNLPELPVSDIEETGRPSQVTADNDEELFDDDAVQRASEQDWIDIPSATAPVDNVEGDDIMDFLTPPVPGPDPLDDVLGGDAENETQDVDVEMESLETTLEHKPEESELKEEESDKPVKKENSEDDEKTHKDKEKAKKWKDRIRRSKEELAAKRELLCSSSSDNEDSGSRKSRPRNHRKKSETKEGIVKKEEASTSNVKSEDTKSGAAEEAAKKSWKDDHKLKMKVQVDVERVDPEIVNMVKEKGYLELVHYKKLNKRGLDELVKKKESGDDTDGSVDSLKGLEEALYKLQKNSIIRTRQYKKTQKENKKVAKENARKLRRSLREANGEFVFSDSDSDSAEERATKVKFDPHKTSDVDGCTGSEDLSDNSDHDSSKKKKGKDTDTRTSKRTAGQKKKYIPATISSSGSDAEADARKELLGSDSEAEKRKKTKKSKGNSDDDSDSDFMKAPKKKTKGRKKAVAVDSDSDVVLLSDSNKSESDSSGSSDSDFKSSKKSKKRNRRSSSSSSDNKKRKKRRKRVVNNDSDDSDKSAGSGSDDENNGSQNKGRKNIRKIISKDELAKSTKQAEKEEEARRKRVAEKQNLFNGIHQAPESDKIERLILDVDTETKEPVLEVDQSIACQLKPHQAEGIKFMYTACFESIDLIKQNKVPGGCILAHCMGLGKTLQTVAFLHTLLTNEVTGIKTALVICPLSTVNNWYLEVRKWTDDADKRIKIHQLYEAKNTVHSRTDYFKQWQRKGGLGLLHYDMFRRLADPKGTTKMKSSLKKLIQEALLDPGPDIVVCDEGHLLKNSKSILAMAVNTLKTRRRIVLTGTPLQNNLVEYHTMMNFVKPNLLGSLPEFTNRFVNPIKNGQHADSTEQDVKTMKRRAHVLHRKLEGCVQRCDYSILAPYLPPKYEYIIHIKLSEKQAELYKHYLNGVADPDPLVRRKNLLKYYAELVKVWSHPIALTMRRHKNKDDDRSTDEDDDNSLKDFVVDDDEDESSSKSSHETGTSSDDGSSKKKSNHKRATRAQTANDPEWEKQQQKAGTLEDALSAGGWWNAVFKSKEEMYDVKISGKLLILQEILKTCEAIGDKVLVFSQFLTSLDIIEEFLDEWDKEAEEKDKEDALTSLMSGAKEGRWRKNIEYFRIDGQTKAGDRQRDCDKFNKKSSLSRAKLFLISTRAGGLGINLFGANRVVIFDASWNPSQDMQSIFRVYRFGQEKPCYIYRLVAQGTMEEKILRRQITKLSLSSRVVDEHQIERHFKFDDVNEMYRYDEEDPSAEEAVLAVPKDRLLADLLMSHREWIRHYEEFDSLLENKPDEGLSNEEKELAWEEFRFESERERQQRTTWPVAGGSNALADADAFLKVKARLVEYHPNASMEQLNTAGTVCVKVIEKIKSLMFLQGIYLHNPVMLEQVNTQVNPLKAWLSAAVGPPPGPTDSAGQPLFHIPEGTILPAIPQEFYIPNPTMQAQPQPQNYQFVNNPARNLMQMHRAGAPRLRTFSNAGPKYMQQPPPAQLMQMQSNIRNIASRMAVPGLRSMGPRHQNPQGNR